MPPIKQILTKVSSLNGAQRRLGHYLQNDSTALLDANVNELAKAVGVSNATVVRFAKSLGYKGFPELKRDIQSGAGRKEIASDRREIRDDRQKIADSRKGLQRSEDKLAAERRDLRDNYRR